MAQESGTDLIQSRIKAVESRTQETLRLVQAKYRSELRTCVEYHEGLAVTLENSGDHDLAYRHRLLADIYRSTLERA